MRALLAKIGIALAALGPPALVGVGLWPDVRAHPALSALALAGYWIVLAIFGFVRRVGAAVQDRWVDRAAEALDDKLTALVAGHHGRYVKRLAASLRYVDLQGLATIGEYALELKDIYVDVSLAPRALHETAGEPFVGAAGGPDERRLLRDVLAVQGVYAVIGGPGSGKTTMLRRTALHSCRGRRLPILIYLRDHAAAILEGTSLSAVVAGLPWLGGAIPETWFERRLDRGRCLIMLDGLDEVADERERRKVVQWVTQQTVRHPECTFAITSRPYGYRENPLTGATVLQVRRFSGEQITRFLRGWYVAIERRATGESGPQVRARAEEKAGDLLGRLHAQPALYDLAANPLLLTMIANVHRYKGALPGSRAQLYGEMVEVLLHRRRESKGLTAGTGLRGEQKARVTRELALRMMLDRRRDIAARQAAEAIGPALERVARTVTPEAFLVETVESGLLVERETGVYAFAHLTLQEYLAAAEIRESGGADLLADRVGDPWWRETTLLWAADTDATAVVEACLELRTVSALSLAYECVEQARETSAEVRDLLDAFLVVDELNHDHRRLVTGVRLHRWLRQVIQLHGETAICATPVPNEIYHLFTATDPVRAIRQVGEPADPALGMWRRDAGAFVEWVNGLTDDGATYRLPTVAELALPATGLVTDLERFMPWTSDSPGPPQLVPRHVVLGPVSLRSVYLVLAILGLLGRDLPGAEGDVAAVAEVMAACRPMRDATVAAGRMGLGHVAALLLDLGTFFRPETLVNLRQVTDLVRRQDFGRVKEHTREVDVAGMVAADMATRLDLRAELWPGWRLAILAYAAFVVSWLSEERRAGARDLRSFGAFVEGTMPRSLRPNADALADDAGLLRLKQPMPPPYEALMDELIHVAKQVGGRVIPADAGVLQSVIVAAAALGQLEVHADAAALYKRLTAPTEVILLVRD